MDDTPPPRLSQEQLVGQNVHKFRKARRLTQTELAHRLLSNRGVPMSQQTLVKVEQGTRPLRLNEAAAIAREMEIPVDALLAGPSADWGRVVVECIEDANSLCHQIDQLGQALLATQSLLESVLNEAPNPFDDPVVLSAQLQHEAERALHARPHPLPATVEEAADQGQDPPDAAPDDRPS